MHDLLLQTGGVLPHPARAEADDADEVGTLEMTLRYPAGQQLRVNVTLDITPGYPDWVHYAFHLQDAGGRCIARWDNAPHHRDLTTFPHHVHLGPGELPADC